MANHFAELTFTPRVRALQTEAGSRGACAKAEAGPSTHDRLTEREAAFIRARDSFYMATVTETGWPYVQHRGGPVGFVKIIDEKTLGFADFRGNRQYVSTGNLLGDDRVSMFFMDYPNRRRLKLLGRVRVAEPDEDAIIQSLEDPGYPARVERAFIISVSAFDWNCPQHITPRYSVRELEALEATPESGSHA
jgi:predicted pyridoxine 5'-phosphate oxidase superfamily flavin-nucleotide-binding protein